MVLSSSEKAKGNAFSKAYSENINTNPQICFMKILDTPSQVPNTPSNVKMTGGTPEVCSVKINLIDF